MTYQVLGLDPVPFAHLFGLSDEALAEHGAYRVLADKKPGFPDRVELRDLEIGEAAILLNFTHQPARTPYRASHAIFVRENAERPFAKAGTIPQVLAARLLSLRAFDAHDMMIDADVVEGSLAEAGIIRLLANPATAYIHVHYAKRGCYAALVVRAPVPPAGGRNVDT